MYGIGFITIVFLFVVWIEEEADIFYEMIILLIDGEIYGLIINLLFPEEV